MGTCIVRSRESDKQEKRLALLFLFVFC